MTRIPFLSIHSKELKVDSNRYLYTHTKVALSIIAKKVEANSKCPSTDERISKCGVCVYVYVYNVYTIVYY